MISEYQVLKPKEVQEELRISRATLYRWIQNGTLPATKLGRLYRFRREDIEKVKKGEM